jgi:hypothetical protein
VGHHGARVFLEVVRRQVVFFGGDEGLEVSPGAPRDQAQLALLVAIQLGLGPGGRRLADAPGDRRRRQPQRQEGQCEVRQPAAREHDGERGEGERQQHAAEHARVEAREVVAHAAEQVGGNPFEHVPARHEHAPQAAAMASHISQAW